MTDPSSALTDLFTGPTSQAHPFAEPSEPATK